MLSVAEHLALLDASDRCLLVVAGPGRGKTTCVLQIAARAQERKLLEAGQQVLTLTFARQAVFQIYDEARRSFSPELLTRSLEIQTYHGFCSWLVSSFGRYAGLAGRVVPLSPLLAKVDAEAPAMLEGAFDDGASHLSFDGIARVAVSLLASSERLRTLVASKYPIVILDEFQDTNETCLELVRLLGMGSSLRLFADPDQHIYGFSGVPPNRVQDAEKTLGARVIRWIFPSLRTKNESLTALLSGLQDPSFTEAELQRRIPSLVVSYMGRNLGVRAKHLLKKLRKNPNETVGFLTWRRADVQRIVRGLREATPKANWKICARQVGDEHLIWAGVVLDWLEWRSQKNRAALRRAFGALCGDKKGKENVYAQSCARTILGNNEIGVVQVETAIAAVLCAKTAEALSNIVRVRAEADDAAGDIPGVVRHLNELVSEEARAYLPEARAWLEHSFPDGATADPITIVRERLQSEQLAASAQQKRLAMKGVFAMTIHSAKGRQFDHTVVVLPAGTFGGKAWRENRKDRRNLIYVAASRSRANTAFLLQSKPTSRKASVGRKRRSAIEPPSAV